MITDSRDYLMSSFAVKRVLCGIAFFLCLLSPIKARTHRVFRVSSYGIEGRSIAKLVSDVNRNHGGRIVFPKGKTIVLTIDEDPNGGHRLLPQDSSIPFSFKDCSYLDIDLNGSTIVLDKNHSSKYALFCFFNCRSFSLRNGSIVGDAMNHDYSPVVYMGNREDSSHEWGHGIMVIGSKGKVTDLSVSYMCGDGLYVASYRKSGTVLDARIELNSCDIGFCRRNGVSCASNTGFKLINSTIHNIGSLGSIIGADPRAGVDFEYEDGVHCLGEVVITGCTIRDCEKKTVTSSNVSVPKVLSFLIEKSSFSVSSFQIANLESVGGKSVRNCCFDKVPINCGDSFIDSCKFIMGSKLHYVHGTSFSNCEFVGSLDGLSGPYGCAIVGNSLDTARFNKCMFRDVRGLDNSSPAYQGISGFNFPLNAYFKGCTFMNTSFVKGNPKYESSFVFEDCLLSNGCMIYNEGGSAVLFRNSTVNNVNSYHTQSGVFIFENCEVIQDDESIENPLLYFGTHLFKNSRIINKLSVTPQMRKKGVTRIKLLEVSE